MTPPPPKKRLGKGMNVLFGNNAPANPPARPARDPNGGVLKVAIEDIIPNRQQPRKKFAEKPLKELAASIAEHGLMQPIVTRKIEGNQYEIIAGERRWRASQLAGLKAVEVVIKDVATEDVFVLALIENIQREDLNPIEEAEAYKQIVDEKNLTQEQLAEAVGKERSSIANVLRLLKLPQRVRTMVAEGALGMGHARCLLSLPSEEEMTKAAQEVVRKGLSARQAEAHVRQLKKGSSPKASVDPYAAFPGGAEAVKRETQALVSVLGTKVRLAVKQGRKGTIEIDFSSYDELNRLIEQLKG